MSDANQQAVSLDKHETKGTSEVEPQWVELDAILGEDEQSQVNPGAWEQSLFARLEEFLNSDASLEPTVLIVDDSITVRELLSMTFNKAGYWVEQARDGQDAWDKLRSGLHCDIIFCDIEMPRMDGIELLDLLQKDEHLNIIPMAILSSRGANKRSWQRMANLGAKGYFTKPYLEEALLEAAGRMLKGEVLIGATEEPKASQLELGSKTETSDLKLEKELAEIAEGLAEIAKLQIAEYEVELEKELTEIAKGLAEIAKLQIAE